MMVSPALANCLLAAHQVRHPVRAGSGSVAFQELVGPAIVDGFLLALGLVANRVGLRQMERKDVAAVTLDLVLEDDVEDAGLEPAEAEQVELAVPAPFHVVRREFVAAVVFHALTQGKEPDGAETGVRFMRVAPRCQGCCDDERVAGLGRGRGGPIRSGNDGGGAGRRPP